MGVAGLGVSAVLGALPAFRCGRGGPRRGARGLRGACPPCWRRAGGHNVAGRGGGRGLLRIWGPSWGGAAGAAAWAAGAASPAGTGSGAGGLGSLGAPWGCSAGRPTGTAAFASCRSSRSAGVSPRASRGDGGAGAGPAEYACVRSERNGRQAEGSAHLVPDLH